MGHTKPDILGMAFGGHLINSRKIFSENIEISSFYLLP
jgi:hypothetical protein